MAATAAIAIGPCGATCHGAEVAESATPKSAMPPVTASVGGATSQSVSGPTLVVGIVVEGLTMENLELLQPLMGDGGFKRLLAEGVVIPDLDYGTPLDGAAAAAMVSTGASPWVNGIAAATHFDNATRQPQPVYWDSSVIGNFTDQTLAPGALRASTLADEMRVAGGGTAYAYAIAPEACTSLALAGHAANSGVWIDSATGRWASSTAYKELPPVTQAINHRNALEYRLDTLQWVPSIDIAKLPALPAHKKLYPFRHIFSRGNANRFREYKNSPVVNADVTSLAGEYLRTLNLGRREGNTDFLGLGYTLNPYSYGRDADGRAEDRDALLRLDRDLQRLFANIEAAGPGMGHTLVFVAGTPATRRQRRDDDQWAIPAGEVSSRKAVGLLNMYLMALYGNGQWVSGYHDGQVYLNRPAIKDGGKDLEAMRREAASFMRRMAGVADAWSIDDVADGKALTQTPGAQRRNLYLPLAGDVVVDIMPGWSEVDDDDEAMTAGSPTAPVHAMRAVASTAPAFILAPELQPRTLTTPVDARVLAPTISSLIRIRAPNGASLPPLRLRH